MPSVWPKITPASATRYRQLFSDWLGSAPAQDTVISVGTDGNVKQASAADLRTGTLADARLSSNVALKNAATEFTNTFTFAGITWQEANATPAYNDYWRGWLASFSGVNTPHSSNQDTVLRFGFNVDSGGARIDASDACFADSIESEYWTAGGTNVLERHWEGVTKQGTSFRVLSALMPKNDADRSVSEISSATDRFVMYDWAKNSRAVFNFTNASVNVLSWEKATVLQFKKNNSYLYQQLNQAENAYINGPFLNTYNVWQSVVKQVIANTDSAHDPGNALLAVRRFGNGTSNEITLDVSLENANNSNLWIGQKWSGVCHGGLEPLIENLSDQSTGLASLRIKTANGGGDARLVLSTNANTIGLGVDTSESAFVISKSASLGTSNVLTVNLSTNLATLANGLHLGTRLGLGSATTPTNYIESVSDGVARIVAQNGSTASELRVASIQDAADSFKFTVGGRLHVGTTAGDAGWLGIQNIINNVSAFNDCAINQAANGYTVVNCSSGQALDLRVANSTRLRCNSDGVKIITNVGFNDTTPIAKPTVTGSRSTNAALASMLTALSNYGLITDSTTAGEFFPANTWLKGGGDDRLYCSTGESTLIRGVGSNPIQFWNASYATVAYLSNAGNFITTGSLDIRYGIQLRDLGTGTSRWLLYRNDGDDNLYLRDMPNARMQVQFYPGNSITNATTIFYSRVEIGESGSETAHSKLSVVGSHATAWGANIEQTGTGDAFLVLRRSGTTPTRWYTYIPSGATDLRLYNAADLFTFTTSGSLGIGTVSPGSRLQIDIASQSAKGFIVKGASSQSANLTEWQNNSNSVLAYVTSGGNIISSNGLISANSEFRLDNNTFSRVAQRNSAGGFGGGYNFNLNSDLPSRDSTGTVSAYYFTSSSIRFFAENSGSPGSISGNERVEINPTDTQIKNNLYVAGTYSIRENALGNVSGSTSINLQNGHYITATATGAVTWSVSNIPAGDDAVGFAIELTNGGNYTQTWPSNTKWPGGITPTLTSNGVDVIVFVTRDNGTTWRACISMLDSK